MTSRIAAASLATLILLSAATARPSATSPTLVISAARAIRGDGRYAVTVEGAFDFPNAVQVGYPLQLVVFQGTRFVRFPIGEAPRTGQADLLTDGLSLDDLPALVAAGGPAPADVRIVSLSATSAVLSLPPDFVPGLATAQLFTILSDGSVLSNPLALVLP